MSSESISSSSFISILRGSPFDSIVLVTTFLLTVLVDLTTAIQVGIVLASLLFMKRMADINTNIPLEDDSESIETYSNPSEEIAVYEIGGPLFFASARQYAETLKTIGYSSKVLIIRMRRVPFIDSTAAHNLEETIKALRDTGIVIVMSGTTDDVYKDLKKNKIIAMIGEENVFKKFSDALAYANTKLLKEIEEEASSF